MNKGLLIAIGVGAIIVLVGIAVVISSNNRTNDSTSINSNTNSLNNNSTDVVVENSRYIEYSAVKFDNNSDKKRVYFFHASWCPTCKIVNKEFSENSAGIPKDVILFKTDYDTENELKKKFGITYQHTFVLVDENGNEVTKWNGGGISELVANTR